MEYPSKQARWQRSHRVGGVPIPVKNAAPILGYKAKQFGVGKTNSEPVGTKSRWYAARADRRKGGKHWAKQARARGAHI